MDIVVQDFFATTGPVAQRLSGFELRPQQQQMAAAVEQAFQRGTHLIAEAGTGVGKSFAYLVPAIAQAALGKKVVISTHTISLQEQLIEKDIPFLQAVSGLVFSAVLCKGRGNYLCMRRLEQAGKKSFSLLPDARSADDLIMVETWAKNTKDGSLSDLPRQPAWQVWDKVCAERGNCLGRRCRYYDGCFYQASRRRIANGQILVCNHAMFFSDLALKSMTTDPENPEKGGRGILPAYDFAVLDEGHTIEAVASDHFGLSVSESQVRYLLHSLFSAKTTRGFLATLDILDTLAAQDAIDRTERAANEFFELLDRWLATRAPKNGRVREQDIIANPLSPALENLGKSLRALADQLAAKSKGQRLIVDDPEEGEKLSGAEYEIEKQRFELQSYMDRIRDMGATINALLAQQVKDAVYWVEATGKTNRRLKWTGSPISVAGQLRTHLFSQRGKLKSVILTSATLSTTRNGEKRKRRNGDFDDDAVAYLSLLISRMCASPVALGPTYEKGFLERAIKQAYATREEVLLADIRDELRAMAAEHPKAKAYADSLELWTTGMYGRLFNRKGALDVNNRVVVFDLQNLENHPDLQSVYFFVIRSIIWGKLLNRSLKKIIVIDEGWKFFNDEVGAELIENLYRTARKFNGAVFPISQSPKDFLDTKAANAIITNSYIKYVLKLTKGHELLSQFELNPNEIEAVKLLQSKPRVFSDLFVKYGNHSLVARIEPCLLDYWICTTDAKDHVYEAKVRAENPGISEAELLLKLTEAK